MKVRAFSGERVPDEDVGGRRLKGSQLVKIGIIILVLQDLGGKNKI